MLKPLGEWGAFSGPSLQKQKFVDSTQLPGGSFLSHGQDLIKKEASAQERPCEVFLHGV